MRPTLLAAAAALLAAGCGDVPRGRVHGTVTYQGKPIPDATVILMAADNKTHPADLGPGGRYEAAGVAYGPVRVSVQQVPPRPASKAEPGKAAAKAGVADEKAGRELPPVDPTRAGPTLPPLYADPDKSGLRFDLDAPDKEWSIDLK